MPLHTQILDPHKKAVSGVIFQPSPHPKHVSEVITIVPTDGRFH